ncbi:MAG TPA: thioesterase family protein [Stellaceae bacterium]|nr:thioesterase family protein [Stellaceae bacterium]
MTAASAEPALEVPIRRSDCDPAGIIYYPNYLDVFEDAIEEWLGAGYRSLVLERGMSLRIVSVDCQFVAPVRMGDRLALRLRRAALEAGRAVLALEGAAAGLPRLAARLTAVCVELGTERCVEFPPELSERLAALEPTSS